jgi:hypothetical protein
MIRIILASLLGLVLVACTTPLPEGVYISPFIGVQKSPKNPPKRDPAPVDEATPDET